MSTTHQTSIVNSSLPTEELAGLRLALRGDLNFTLQKFGSDTCYVIEDPVHSAFYRIGPVEYAFVSLLTGQNTVNEAMAKTAIALGRDAITEQEASTICRWLTDQKLAVTSQALHGQRFSRLQANADLSRWRRWVNPLSISLTLGNPSGFLHSLLPVTRWMFGPVGFAFWITILSISAIRLLVDGGDLIRNASPAIAPDNWIWLGICWLGMKIVHECSHGLCCLRYGGTVRSYGINFVMFAPLPFIDASSAWRFASRWQRIHVAFAGIYAELLIAAIAAIVRSFSDNEILRTLCLNVMLTGGVLTLLFNLNPLSRFDGYYMLCDWLEMPNLGQSAHQIVMQSTKRLFFGVRGTTLYSWQTSTLLWLYGALSSFWRFCVTVSMIIAAERLFHGAGLPLAVLAGILWIAKPILSGVSYIVRGHLGERPSRIRFAAILLLLIVAGAWLGRVVMWPEQLELPAVVDFIPAENVRCRVGGFVDEVTVEPGQQVRAGDELLKLANPQVDFEIAELRLEVSRAHVRQQYFQSIGDIASRQTEDAMLISLEKQLSEKQAMQDQLIIRTPVDGIVIASDLKNLPGQFLTPGQSVCIIGNPAEKQVRLVIAQDDIEAVLAHEGGQVGVQFRGDTTKSAVGILTSLDQRATSELIHPALASVAGGPLAVQVASRSEQHSSNGMSSEPAQWLLPSPCFTGRVSIPEPLRTQCGAGQLATVIVTTNSTSLGERVWTMTREYFTSKLSDDQNSRL